MLRATRRRLRALQWAACALHTLGADSNETCHRYRRNLFQIERPESFVRLVQNPSGPAPIALPADALKLDARWDYAVADGRNHYLVKAKLGRQIIGRAHGWYTPGAEFVLEKIELDARHRSKGFGTEIIDYLRAHARTQQCTHFVFAGVMRANAGAIRLYESMQAVAGPLKDDGRAYTITPP